MAKLKPKYYQEHLMLLENKRRRDGNTQTLSGQKNGENKMNKWLRSVLKEIGDTQKYPTL